MCQLCLIFNPPNGGNGIAYIPIAKARGLTRQRIKVKASQRENRLASGDLSYDLWLEVAVNFGSVANNWTVQLETAAPTPFDTGFVERRFLSWFSLRLATGSAKGLLFYVTPPYNTTPTGDAFIREVSQWLSEHFESN